jgi:hypothetical protein
MLSFGQLDKEEIATILSRWLSDEFTWQPIKKG